VARGNSYPLEKSSGFFIGAGGRAGHQRSVTLELAYISMPEVTVKRILSPEEWIKRQIDTLKSVGESNYGVGIASPRKDPIETGIKAENKWAGAIKKAIEKKLRAAGLRATNMNEWYNYSSTIGKGRLVEGVVKRLPEVESFVKAWHPMLVDHVSKIDAMPDVFDKDREERMLANLRGLKALHGKYKAA